VTKPTRLRAAENVQLLQILDVDQSIEVYENLVPREEKLVVDGAMADAMAREVGLTRYTDLRKAVER
jgi:hypothetical protein